MDRPARTFVLPVPLSRMVAPYATIRKPQPNIGTTNLIPVTIVTSSEGLESITSMFEDVDVAAEQAKLTSMNVKVKAAVAATASANQMPQELLTLLQ